MQIFYIINTGKEFGFSLKNSLGWESLYACFVKKGDARESRYEEKLGGFESYDRTDAVGRCAKLVRKKQRLGKLNVFVDILSGLVTLPIKFTSICHIWKTTQWWQDKHVTCACSRLVLRNEVYWEGTGFAPESSWSNICILGEKSEMFDFWQVLIGTLRL